MMIDQETIKQIVWLICGAINAIVIYKNIKQHESPIKMIIIGMGALMGPILTIIFGILYLGSIDLRIKKKEEAIKTIRTRFDDLLKK
jgi:hypothetical protein